MLSISLLYNLDFFRIFNPHPVHFKPSELKQLGISLNKLTSRQTIQRDLTILVTHMRIGSISQLWKKNHLHWTYELSPLSVSFAQVFFVLFSLALLLSVTFQETGPMLVVNPFLTNVPLTDKPGSWFLLEIKICFLVWKFEFQECATDFM